MSKIKNRLIRAIIAFIIFLITIIISNTIGLLWYIELIVSLIAYLIAGYDILWKALRNIRHGLVFDENFLMIVATIGAFATSEFEEAVMVMVLYQVGEAFQDYAVNKSRGSISSLMNLRPDFANVIKDDKIVEVFPEEVSVGETIIVKPGEKIPLDGIVCDGASSIDNFSLSGETKLRQVDVGDEVFSGSVNQSGTIKIAVTKPYSESTVAKILELVENASSKKAKAENFISKFAKYYTPIVVIAALILAIFPPLIIYFINNDNQFVDYIQRACTFLVISCPCALVISVPLSFFGGIGGASKLGILIKGSNYVEKISKINRIAFDKTGTLTKGNFVVSKVCAVNDSEENIIKYAAYAEFYSNHPLAESIKKYYNKDIEKNRIQSSKEVAGKGIELLMEGSLYLVGNSKLLNNYKIDFKEVNEIGTTIYVAKDDTYLGYIVIADEVKVEAKILMTDLAKMNITDTIMLTGDNYDVANKVAQDIGIKTVYANLLPQDKVEIIEKEMKEDNRVLAYCGDGINDAPVLMRADVGIAMGALGSDAAIEAADVILMDDDINKIPKSIKLAKKIMKIVYQNIVFAILVKLIVLILGAFGLANMWLAIFADVGVACLCILNAMRTLYIRKFKDN